MNKSIRSIKIFWWVSILCLSWRLQRDCCRKPCLDLRLGHNELPPMLPISVSPLRELPFELLEGVTEGWKDGQCRSVDELYVVVTWWQSFVIWDHLLMKRRSLPPIGVNVCGTCITGSLTEKSCLRAERGESSVEVLDSWIRYSDWSCCMVWHFCPSHCHTHWSGLVKKFLWSPTGSVLEAVFDKAAIVSALTIMAFCTAGHGPNNHDPSGLESL